MINVIANVKNTISRIKDFFAAPEGNTFAASFATTPASAVMDSVAHEQLVNSNRNMNMRASISAERNLPQGFAAAPEYQVSMSMSVISAVLSGAHSEQQRAVERNCQNKNEHNEQRNDVSALHNAHMFAMTPVSGIYAAALSEQLRARAESGMLSGTSAAADKANAEASAQFNTVSVKSAQTSKSVSVLQNAHMFALTPASGVYAAALSEQLRATAERDGDYVKTQSKAPVSFLNFAHMFASTPAAAQTTADMSAQLHAAAGQPLEADPQAARTAEQAHKAVAPVRALHNAHMFALTPASGIYAAALSEQLRATAERDGDYVKTVKHEAPTKALHFAGIFAQAPVSAQFAASLYEQLRNHNATQRPAANETGFSVVEDGFDISPAMSLVSGVLSAALNEEMSSRKSSTRHDAPSAQELVAQYQQMYSEQGYDDVQSMIMASINAARDTVERTAEQDIQAPAFDAATEKHVASRWDGIWKQLSLDSCTINTHAGHGANESEADIRAPFERYYDDQGQLINAKISPDHAA
ncbi:MULTISPECIES: hypothetical protein [unclassified Anaerobiospirillum]|uniref:hypothetical protein n=1 Tax=unclassified Anaerobiospirillum TaxID=2647410 RepID=UPI001FF15614|nr:MULTISPECIES: hypothetical protein [unclassified Anaerobiospirillum]MCK0535986.1 hypothetical protein [Anaerobiospirillum sp. NML120511]MCK0541164.1 hypothetical protein [Anaerobiospirillum sp. NML02-A-032]